MHLQIECSRRLLLLTRRIALMKASSLHSSYILSRLGFFEAACPCSIAMPLLYCCYGRCVLELVLVLATGSFWLVEWKEVVEEAGGEACRVYIGAVSFLLQLNNIMCDNTPAAR